MAYRVYLVEPVDVDNWVELDCENVDFTTIFAVADVSDISKRKDNITKQIAFKGSPVNNEAFGNLFHLNRTADFTLDNKLFFNNNPLRTVDCLIYEDSILLLRGSLRVMDIDVDRFKNITYQTVVTGSFIDFRDIVSEKMLTDLSFSDLKHRFSWNTIQESWEQRTERYNVTGATYEFKPFKKGSGYVYPHIDYGVHFQKPGEPYNVNKINIENFRPAVYVREYFDRIFSQPELKGYTYEIKGSQEQVDKFNSLVIPNNTEKVTQTVTGAKVEAFNTSEIIQRTQQTEYGTGYMSRAIQLPSLNNTSNILNYYGTYRNQNGVVFVVQRAFTASGYVKFKVKSLVNLWDNPIQVKFQLVEREFINAGDSTFGNASTWSEVAGGFHTLNIEAKGGVLDKVIEIQVPEKTYNQNSQLMLRMHVTGAGNAYQLEGVMGPRTIYTITEAVMRFPKDNNSTLTFDVQAGDVVTPSPVPNIKQMDFIKSVVGLFNFYVYSTKERPKHLVFQTYDDYYALTQPHLLVGNALDWTAKIDYSKELKIKSNVQIPKKYLFTLKEDSDYLNNQYKLAWNEVYGTYRFNDSYGLTEEKKVESIFSPSPLMQELGTGRVYPAIYTLDGGNKKPIKSNIRILYYNGVKSCTSYDVAKDTITGGTPDVGVVASGVTQYAQVGNFLLGSGLNNMVPKENLYWGAAKYAWFQETTAHQTVPTAYTNYYRGQVTDLTNPNVTYVECQVYLNEVDIANLNLKVPVFVDMGKLGHAYFKVLSVEYDRNDTTSTVLLQKIAI